MAVALTATAAARAAAMPPSGGKEATAILIYGRAFGWRAKHAISLGHWILSPLWLGLEPGWN